MQLHTHVPLCISELRTYLIIEVKGCSGLNQLMAKIFISSFSSDVQSCSELLCNNATATAIHTLSLDGVCESKGLQFSHVIRLKSSFRSHILDWLSLNG